MHFHTADVLPKHPAPTPGQHTHEVLTELGYSAAEISRLGDAKVIS
jgi:crotonobetainyl-CoA:carnitine CoA-transferase CaiB-like acyl-CoA transferase